MVSNYIIQEDFTNLQSKCTPVVLFNCTFRMEGSQQQSKQQRSKVRVASGTQTAMAAERTTPFRPPLRNGCNLLLQIPPQPSPPENRGTALLASKGTLRPQISQWSLGNALIRLFNREKSSCQPIESARRRDQLLRSMLLKSTFSMLQ